jgi:hypothetical protein
MLFCQVGRAHSLREICGGLACCEGRLKHLGVRVAPKRSTLAYVTVHQHLDGTLSLSYGPHAFGRYDERGVPILNARMATGKAVGD